MPIDLVKPLKMETDEGDFGSVEMDPNQDYCQAKGFVVGSNESVRIESDESGNMLFNDIISGSGYSLADFLESGSGVTEEEHRALDQLVHNIAETSYTEIIRDGIKVTDIIIWETNEKLKKIRETNMTYSGIFVSQTVCKQYNSTGTLVETYTESYNRDSNNFVISTNNTFS